jgi:hypothetical protein
MPERETKTFKAAISQVHTFVIIDRLVSNKHTHTSISGVQTYKVPILVVLMVGLTSEMQT